MKIKNICSLTLLLATPAIFSALVPATTTTVKAPASEIKVGYFNSAQAFSESKLGKEVIAEMEKKRTGYEADFKKDEAAYTKKIADIKPKAATMSEAAKQKAQEELMEMERNLGNKAKGYEEKIKLAARQVQEKAEKYITEGVIKSGSSQGKDVMVDLASSRMYWVNPNKQDSTSSVILHMDSAYNKAVQAKKPVTK